MTLPSEEIKEKLDIVDIIKGYIELQPAGRNFKARCPFHGERTPSFMVSPERQVWHCFGCGEGGDIFTFVMKYENLEFSEALKLLAEKAGVDLRRSSPADHQQFGVLYDINRAACDLFREMFENSERAQEYVKTRGLGNDIVQLFEIGFAPQGYDTLVISLSRQGFKIEDIVRAGLAFRTEKGKYLDRFRGRIMFPIHNHFGKVVGFSGRILPELDTGEMGKYVNSPETPIFNKSRLLYGFWQSKSFVREKNTVIIVEGQMDFLMLYRDAVTNTIASSGTALTVDHLRTLRRFADTIVLIFDNDDAGRMAAERGIDLAGEFDFSVKIVPLTEFKDPADAVIAQSGYIAERIANAQSAMEYYFSTYLQNGTIESKKQGIRKTLGKIKKLGSSIDRAYWVKELSFKVGFSEKDLFAEMDSLGEQQLSMIRTIDKKDTQLQEEDSFLPKDRIGKIAWQLFELAHLNQSLLERLSESYHFLPELYQKAYDVLVKSMEGDSTVRELLDRMQLHATLIINSSVFSSEDEFVVLTRELIVEYYKKELEDMRRCITQAETGGDEEALRKYLCQFDDISRKMQDIKNGKK
ncbi:MAG: DNA primase [bacterium]